MDGYSFRTEDEILDGIDEDMYYENIQTSQINYLLDLAGMFVERKVAGKETFNIYKNLQYIPESELQSEDISILRSYLFKDVWFYINCRMAGFKK
jgi:hypothetical protein